MIEPEVVLAPNNHANVSLTTILSFGLCDGNQRHSRLGAGLIAIKPANQIQRLRSLETGTDISMKQQLLTSWFLMMSRWYNSNFQPPSLFLYSCVAFPSVRRDDLKTPLGSAQKFMRCLMLKSSAFDLRFEGAVTPTLTFIRTSNTLLKREFSIIWH
jgi:hypothetical protein